MSENCYSPANGLVLNFGIPGKKIDVKKIQNNRNGRFSCFKTCTFLSKMSKKAIFLGLFLQAKKSKNKNRRLLWTLGAKNWFFGCFFFCQTKQKSKKSLPNWGWNTAWMLKKWGQFSFQDVFFSFCPSYGVIKANLDRYFFQKTC